MSLTPTRRRALVRLYGLSEEDFTALLEHQGNRCGICDRPFTASREPRVDHSHSSGLIRGLLCHHDNHDVLGHLREDPDYFARIAAYLRFPPAVAAIGEHRVPGSPPAAFTDVALPGMEMERPPQIE